MTKRTFSVTTDASGDYASTDGTHVMGRVVAVEADISGFDATADTTISVTNTTSGVDKTLLTLTNANTDANYELRALGSTNAGASTSEYVHPFVAGNLKVVVAQGGNAKTGTIVVWVE